MCCKTRQPASFRARAGDLQKKTHLRDILKTHSSCSQWLAAPVTMSPAAIGTWTTNRGATFDCSGSVYSTIRHFFCHYSDRTPENLLAPYIRWNMLACWHLKTEWVCSLAASPDSVYQCRIVGSKSRENTGKSVLMAAAWINIFWRRWRDVVGRHLHLTGETGWQFSIQRESFFLCRCQAAVAVSGSSTRHRASCLFNE